MVNIKENDLSHGSEIFKFNHSVGFLLCISIINLMFFSFVVIQLIDKDYLGSLAFLLVLMFFLSIELIHVVVTSNIVITSNGVSRSIFGKIFQTFDWKDIELIRVSNTLDRKGENYNIYSSISKSKSGKILGKKMAFDNNMINSSEFIIMMNKYVIIHSIKIENVAGNVKTYPVHL